MYKVTAMIFIEYAVVPTSYRMTICPEKCSPVKRAYTPSCIPIFGSCKIKNAFLPNNKLLAKEKVKRPLRRMKVFRR